MRHKLHIIQTSFLAAIVFIILFYFIIYLLFIFPRNSQLTAKTKEGTHGEHLYILLLNNNQHPPPPRPFYSPSNMVFSHPIVSSNNQRLFSFSFYFFLYLFMFTKLSVSFLIYNFYYTFFSEIIPHNHSSCHNTVILYPATHTCGTILILVNPVQYILLAKINMPVNPYPMSHVDIPSPELHYPPYLHIHPLFFSIPIASKQHNQRNSIHQTSLSPSSH